MSTARVFGKSARDWLDDVLQLFPETALTLDAMRVVQGSDVPEPYHSLLVHHHHMTVTLEEYHGRPVTLEVLGVRHLPEKSDYARKLVLHAGEDGPVVMAGIMRLRLEHTRDDVRRDVVEARTPLGRILIEHEVLRRVEALAYLRVSLDSAFGKLFGSHGTAGFTYGRIAVIFVDEEPAVELLEIVSPGELETLDG